MTVYALILLQPDKQETEWKTFFPETKARYRSFYFIEYMFHQFALPLKNIPADEYFFHDEKEEKRT